MPEHENKTRLDRFEKRRKNTKRITILSILASIFVFILIISIVISPNDNAEQKDKTEKITENQNESKNEKPTMDQKESKENEEEQNREKDSDKKEKESDEKEVPGDGIVTEVVPSSDENVAHAFKANWEPIGTDQTEPHTINFNEGSQDRKELEEAIGIATELDDMTVWWLERESEQEVKATVSNNKDQSEVYRVYIEWVESKGWKAVKIEVLKENDQKWRFN